VRQDTATGSALKMTYLSCHALAGKQPPRQDSRLSVITSPPTLCPPPSRGLRRSACQAFSDQSGPRRHIHVPGVLARRQPALSRDVTGTLDTDVPEPP